MTFDLGAAAQLTFTTLDSTGAAANAPTCQITITLPDGTTVGPTTLTGTAGVYTYQYVTTQAGRHTYRFATTGTPAPGVGGGAYADVFNVYPATSNALISVADGKALLRIAATNTTFDTDLRGFIASISRFMDRYVGDNAPKQVTERKRSGGYAWMLNHIPVYKPAAQAYALTSVTPVQTYGYVYDLSQLSVDLATGEVKSTIGLPFMLGDYDVTYWAGRIITTENILLGVEIMLKHLWALERNNGRPTGWTPSAADDTTLMYGFAVPNRALEVLEPDRTPAGIA